jgi:hypothetical protein
MITIYHLVLWANWNPKRKQQFKSLQYNITKKSLLKTVTIPVYIVFSKNKDIDVDEHQRLSNFILRHKLKWKNNSYCCFTLHSHSRDSTMSVTRTLKWMWDGH